MKPPLQVKCKEEQLQSTLGAGVHPLHSLF